MATTYLSRAAADFGTPTNRKKCTISFWLKRASLTVQQAVMGVETTPAGGANEARFILRGDDTLEFYDYQSGYKFRYITNRLIRDTSAWYNIVLAVDTTHPTGSERVKIYINGVQETSFSSSTDPAQDLDTFINSGNYLQIGRQSTGNSYLNGSLSHYNFIDGTTYDATAFGSTDSTTGEWKINTTPTVSYGTNGFFILKDGNSVTDASTNTNNFTVSGGTLTKTEDNPSNVFSVWNSLANQGSVPLYNGNTRAVFTAGGWNFVYSTLGASSGKYYYEVKAANTGSDSNIGIMEMDTATNEQGTADNVGKNTESVGYASNGSIKKNNVTVQTGLGSISNGEILGIAMDLDNNTVQFYLQGVSRGTAVSIASDKTYAFATSGYGSAEHHTNFGNGYFETTAVSSAGTNASGNGIFEYDVPANFTALSTKGLNL